MDGKKHYGSSSSSSSFTSDLFGTKESSSSGILKSIFAPSSKSAVDGVGKQKRDGTNENPQAYQGSTNKDVNPYYQEEKVQPCHLSSSIYYGGPDVYSRPKNTQTTQSSAYTTTYNKDGGEDDSGSASRGNWWQGSLYY